MGRTSTGYGRGLKRPRHGRSGERVRWVGKGSARRPVPQEPRKVVHDEGDGKHRAHCKQCRFGWATGRGYVQLERSAPDWFPGSLIRAGGRFSPYVDRWAWQVVHRAVVDDRRKAAAVRFYARHHKARRAFEAAVALAGGEDAVLVGQIVTRYVDGLFEWLVSAVRRGAA